jgi:hypothetical protein
LYVTFPKAVYQITADGKITAVAESIQVADGDKDIVEGTPKDEWPYLRGLAVDARGTVYATATGCRSVVKITADGKVETVLKADRPWSPTGIAVQGDAIYVLEYPNQTDEKREEWVPRVRKVGRDGKATTLVTFPKKDRSCKLPIIVAELFMASSIQVPKIYGGDALFLPGRYSRNCP